MTEFLVGCAAVTAILLLFYALGAAAVFSFTGKTSAALSNVLFGALLSLAGTVVVTLVTLLLAGINALGVWVLKAFEL